MTTDRRRDLATAATGGVLLAGGGGLRHAGVARAFPKVKPKVHAVGMLRAAKGKRLFWGGSALGLVGLPPLAVGTTHAIRGDVDKADDRRGFWREGLGGTKDALKQRADNTFQPVPAKLRALQLGVGAGAGAVGSLATRAALGHRGNAVKPLLTPIAGGLAATASVPLSNRAVRRRYPGYEVTPTGVRRRKTDPKRPSSKSSRYAPMPRRFSSDVGKADDRRRSGAAMAGAGTVLGGGGFIAGGIPGVREPDGKAIWDIKGHKPREWVSRPNLAHNGKIALPQARAGILGFRTAIHNAYVEESKAKGRANSYVKGNRAGKLEAEQKIIRGMRTGRRATYPLTLGGAALAAAGVHRARSKPVTKRDMTETASAAALAGGGTLATAGHFVPKGLNRISRRYSISAKEHVRSAERLAPHFGGLQVVPAKHGPFGELKRPARETMYPARTDSELAQNKAADRIKGGAKVREQVGRHRGIAAQERHFVEVFDNTSGVMRRLRGPGLALSAAGASGLLAAREARQRGVRKADTRYRGAQTPYYKQRAAITASGHPPVIGPITSSVTAARYAPPGEARKEGLRQLALGSGVGVPVGAAAAYGGAHLANRSDKAALVAGKLVSAKEKVEGHARRAVGLGEKTGKGPVGRATARFLETKAGTPFRSPRGKIGGVAGFAAGRMVVGGVGGQTAITLNQRDQRRYNKVHHIEKFDPGGRGHSKREKQVLAQRKRKSAVLSTTGGTLGLTSLGLLAAGKRNAALTTGTIGSGLGGVNALLGARVQRQEAQHLDPIKKALGPASRKRAAQLWARMDSQRPKYGKISGFNTPMSRVTHLQDRISMPSRFDIARRRSAGEGTGIPHLSQYISDQKYDTYMRRVLGGEKASPPRRLLPSTKRGIGKAAPLAITGTDREHHDAIRRYGDRGPLPKELGREDRMKVYEARYVHHGGDRQNTWRRRTKIGDRAKNAGLGVATAGTAAWLATRGRRATPMLAHHPRLKHHAETVTGAGAVVGGLGEMLSGYGHHRQSSYANSPGGVAASALRRMRDNTPEGQTS